MTYQFRYRQRHGRKMLIQKRVSCRVEIRRNYLHFRVCQDIQKMQIIKMLILTKSGKL